MGKIVPNSSQRAVERVFAAPANRTAAIAQQQQGSLSGQVPGTSSPYNQTAIGYGLLQPSGSGDNVSAVGHTVYSNAGLPVVTFGNLNVGNTSGDPPSSFQDGGFVLLDASGNAIAGHSHPTGPWGFGGGGGGGSVSVIPCPFAYDSPDIETTGFAAYTPTVGDILLNAWIEIDTAWNGTTPSGDFGSPPHSSGIFNQFTGYPLDMTIADQALNPSATNLSYATQVTDLMTLAAVYAAANLGQVGTSPYLEIIPGPPSPLPYASRIVPAKFITDDPIVIWVNQSGDGGGVSSGSTQGSGVLWVHVATPT